MNGNDIVADFIRTLSWEALPPEVRHKAKLCLLDGLGATITGTLAPITGIARKYMTALWPGGNEATMLMSGQRCSAAGAAFVNACAANGLDVDDDGAYTRGHPGAQIIPVCLAMAEKQGASGRQMLEALVIGYEVAHRIGHCWHRDHPVYQACGSWGSVANAAVAARLMGLEHEQIKHALGIADYNAPNLPMMRDIDHPTMVKHGIGWGALTGIMAAGLAANGFTAVPSLLGEPQYHDWVATIGREYLMVEGITFKRFASCLWGHPPFAATTELISRHGIEIEDIAHIKITGFNEMVRLGAELPHTEEQAQFSVGWPLAALLVDGEVGPEQMLQKRYTDPVICDLVRKIELVESEEMNRLAASAHYPCRVEITLADGRTHSSGITYYDSCGVGDKENPFGDMWRAEEVKEKFVWLCRAALDETTVHACLDLVEGFETLADLESLMALVNGG